jgi:hypothetical protein
LRRLFSSFILAVFLLGKKPKKVKLSLAKPEADKAVISALAPGIGTTLRSSFFA